MVSMIAGLIQITIGVIVLVNVFIVTVKNANTTGWTASETALWATVSLAGIIGIVVGTFQVFGLL